MSYGEKIFEIVTDISSDVGELKSDMAHVKEKIEKLEKKKNWAKNIDWTKAGKGIGYVILSIAALAGGGAGVTALLQFFQ